MFVSFVINFKELPVMLPVFFSRSKFVEASSLFHLLYGPFRQPCRMLYIYSLAILLRMLQCRFYEPDSISSICSIVIISARQSLKPVVERDNNLLPFPSSSRPGVSNRRCLLPIFSFLVVLINTPGSIPLRVFFVCFKTSDVYFYHL